MKYKCTMATELDHWNGLRFGTSKSISWTTRKGDRQQLKVAVGTGVQVLSN